MSVLANLTEVSVETEQNGTDNSTYNARALRELAAELEDSLKSTEEDERFDLLRRELFGQAPDLDSANLDALSDSNGPASPMAQNPPPIPAQTTPPVQAPPAPPAPPPSHPHASHAPEKLEVLAESVTAMQASMAELRNQLDQTGQQQRQFAQLVSTRLSTELKPDQTPDMMATLDTRFESVIKASETRTQDMVSGLNTHMQQNEQRNATAIKEVGAQMARASARMEERQKEILSGLDARLDRSTQEQKQTFDQAMSGIHQRMESVAHESRQATDPIRNTMASLALRIDALETSGQSPQMAAAPPVSSPMTGQAPPPEAQIANPNLQGATTHLSMPNMGHSPAHNDHNHRYAAPAQPRSAGDECWRAVRDKINEAPQDTDLLEPNAAFLYERRGKLPIVAASALALAVAGGGALSSMRGKENMIAPVAEIAASTPDKAFVRSGDRRIVVKKSSAKASPAQLESQEPEIKLQYTSLEQAVQAGFPRALYEQGLKDLAAGEKVQGAVKMQRAAEAGLAVAQYRMSKLYERGEGVPRSISRARAWVELSAKDGNVRAMHDTAVFYAEGDGGTQNYAVAIDWFHKAALSGLGDSQYNLGVLYEQGLGVSRDLQEAVYWYELSGIAGDPDGARRVRELLDEHDELTPDTLHARTEKFVAIAADSKANGQFGPPVWGIEPVQSGESAKDALVAGISGEQTIIEQSLSSLDIAEIQVLLKRLGFEPGPSDGVVGSGTRRAIMAFEYRNKMTPTGQANAKLRSILRERVFGTVG